MTIYKKRIVALLVLVLLCSAFVPQVSFAQAIDPSFDPNKLIEDKVFADTKTFGGPEGIQKFLESKNSILANKSLDFIAKLKEPTITMLKTSIEDPRPNLPTLRSAADLIWDAAQQSGMNPQVILVTLQKEQGLITTHQNDTPERLQRALDNAMGFDCPDNTGCGALFPGFYFQLFGNVDSSGNRYLGAAKSLMKSFSVVEGRGPTINGKTYKVGEIVELGNTLGGYDGVVERQTVMLTNNATAALYRYTPHVFNGNYNFQKYFTAWFKYPNGTIMKLANDTATYIIQNGSRLMLPQFVAQARGLDLSKTITVSPTEVENYPTGPVYGPVDNTIVLVTGDTQKYVFLDNVKHPVSDFVIGQRKLNPAATLSISPAEAQLFPAGDVLTPSDGTVIKAQSKPEVYLVSGGKLQMYSAFTFQQRGVAKQVQIVSDGEVATYPKQGFVAPLDGTLVKAPKDGAVFEVRQGVKHPLTAELFRNRGLSFKNVVTLSSEEVNSFGVDGFALPKDKTFFKVAETGQLYFFKEGTKRTISAFVAKQQHITPDYTFGKGEADSWADGIAVAPRDGTYLKGDATADVYYVAKGQLHPITYAVYKARKLTPAKISTIPQAEVDAYAKGDLIAK